MNGRPLRLSGPKTPEWLHLMPTQSQKLCYPPKGMVSLGSRETQDLNYSHYKIAAASTNYWTSQVELVLKHVGVWGQGQIFQHGQPIYYDLQ